MTISSSDLELSGLDRHHLHNVRSAFLKLNQSRLDLARDGLNDTQITFLDVLPMLFHYNHPMLPGYISRNTPAGLYGFRETEEGLQKLKRLTRSFQSNRRQHQTADILAIYAMGSFGTIAQNKRSDIDIWLCHRPGLSDDELLYLKNKTKSISIWGKKMGLDVTIFLMNHETYHTKKEHDFSHDASGSTQHYLLLDEFYRTAIYLGGQLPIWLFVRTEQESQYPEFRENLIHRRLLPDNHFIDFGAIAQVPADEFISSAIWQLYKAINSPYKSILKLLLLEIYCQNFDKPCLLSTLFKDQLHGVDHHRVINHWDVDPYLQNYYYIEDYLLSTNQHPRLEFLRRCFYFKLGRPLTGGAEISTRSSILLEMTKKWGWNETYVAHLDNHKRWGLRDVLEERRLIINELNHSYQLVMDFFRTQKAPMHASNRELNILGRKLQAAFSRKAGKIEWVNPLPSKNISEPLLYIRNQKETSQWSAYNDSNNIIVKKATPMELMTWLHCNQVMIPASKVCFSELDANDNDQKMDMRILQSLRRLISSLIPLPIETADHRAFEKSSYLSQLLLFIDYRPNIHAQALNEFSAVDFSRIESTVDMLVVNSWNEIVCNSKKGRLLDTLLMIYMQAIQNNQVNEKTDILCNHPDRYFQQAVRKTIKPLFANVYAFFSKKTSGRFIGYINERYLVIHNHDKRCVIKWLDNDDEVKSLLMSPMPYYSPVEFDPGTMEKHPLAVFARRHVKESLQIFYRCRGEYADITLIDEQGTWYEGEIEYKLGKASLQTLHRFLRAVTSRRQDNPSLEMSPFDIFPMTFSELVNNKSGVWELVGRSIGSQVDSRLGVPIYAVCECVSGRYLFTLYVDEMRFSEVDDGDKAYEQLAFFIKREQQKNHYVSLYYINDLDLSRCDNELNHKGELYTSHYLIMKDHLQKKIDRALK